MQTVAPRPPTSTRTDTPTLARRSGYAVAAGVNIALILIVNSLLEWGWPRFLTRDFEQVLPWVNVSLGATIAVNLLYMAYDADWFKSGWQVVLSLISLAVLVRTYRVFPFDFSDFTWPAETVARTIMWIAGIALVLAIVAEGVRSVTALARRIIN